MKCLVLWVFLASITLLTASAQNQNKDIVWSSAEQPIRDHIHGLRALPDDVRATTTRQIALNIRELPSTENKLRLAVGLAGLSTEGDFGHDTLQQVATTLAEALRERPMPWSQARDAATTAGSSARVPAYPYTELATLVRYEHVDAATEFKNDDGQYAAAMAQLQADDLKRQHPEFTLKDLSGKSWTFADLRQSGAGEFLGDMVSAVPKGNARSGGALRAVWIPEFRGARHLGRRVG